MNSINHYKQWMQSHADVGIDLVRMYLGVGLLVKGVHFMSNPDYLTQLLGTSDNTLFVQAAVAHYVIPAHLVGGFLLAIGLLTRLAALSQIPILLGAIFYVHLPKTMLIQPRENLEFSALVLFLLILVFAYGSGQWSVDHYLSKKGSESESVPSQV